jgi:hypothetical protein
VALARSAAEVGRLLVLAVAYTAVSLPLSIVLVSAAGIDGAGMAWLVSQFIVGSGGGDLVTRVIQEGVTDGKISRSKTLNCSASIISGSYGLGRAGHKMTRTISRRLTIT